MLELPLKGYVLGYADDTSLVYSPRDWREVDEWFTHDKNILLPWLKKNQLHLNVEKCESILYAYKEPEWAGNLKLKIGGRHLSKNKVTKYLGVKLDEKLTWKAHSLYLQSKLRKLNYLFWNLKNYFSRKHLCKLYQSLYESVLTYGIVHWGGTHHLKPLKVLQNSVCRCILGLEKRTSETEIYSKMKMPRLENLHKIRVALFVFKNKLKFGVHDSVTLSRRGGGMVAEYPRLKKHHSRIQLLYMGYEIFNRLPLHNRNDLRLSTYKKSIKSIFNK